jgi:hypothetical protein
MPRSIAEVNALRGSSHTPSAEGELPRDGRDGFDPKQPRVPAGHSDGGRWTSTGANGPASSRREVALDDTGEEAWESVTSTYRPDGTLAEQEVVNRDGSRIHSQFSLDPHMAGWDERHTVTLPDGQQITFENNGDTQTIYDADGRPISASTWTSNGPEPEAVVQQAFVPAVVVGAVAGAAAARAAVQAALVLGTWLAGRNGLDGTAVVSFPVTVYQPGADKQLHPIWVGRLTDKELKDSCPKYRDVQSETDEAASKTDRADYSSAATYGTAVHWKLHQQIGELNKEGEKDLHSEVSYLKTVAETGDKPDKVNYGTKGSIRVDVLEKTDKGAVCVYDIKTGLSGLYPGRSLEIAAAVHKYHSDAQSILVIEMRPSRRH